MLAGARLCDDSLLPEPLREHRLPKRVVQLVCAGVQKVFAFEVETLAGRETLRERQRRGPARVGAAQFVELGAEEGIVGRVAPTCLQLVERRDQRLRNVASAVRAVQADRHRAAATNVRTFS